MTAKTIAFCNTVFFICLLLIFFARSAQAEFKGLLLLGDLKQSIVLDYIYTGQESMPKRANSTSSSSNRFSETYNAGMEYSILHPYIMDGHLKAGVGLEQQIYSSPTSSSSGGGSRYFYDIDGRIFKISPTPVTFSARSETMHILIPFTPGYDVTTDSYSVGASFKHKIIGFRIDYQNTTSETSGTSSDSKQAISMLMLNAGNDYKNSTTELQISHLTSELELLSGSGVTRSESNSILAKNLLFSSNRDKTLSSSIAYREEKQTGITKTFSWGEAFSWQLGKALNLGISYEDSSVTTTGVTAGTSTDTRQQIETIILSHQLYKSLSSRLKLQGRQNDRNIGRETEYSGSVNFYYTKKLSTADTLTLNYSEEYSVIKRNLSSGDLTAIDEPLTAQLNGNNLLQQPNVIISSIIVRDQVNSLIRYDDRDFRIIRNGPFTGFDFSVIGSRITDGTRLLVTYQYQVDASVNYRRSARGGGGAITFYDGTYQLYANIAQSSQEITSGQTGIFRPSSSMDYMLGATRNKNGIYANIVYVKSDSEQIKNQYIEGTLRLTRFFDGSSWNAQIRDRQTWYGATEFNAPHSDNQLSISSDYARNIFSNAILTLRALYFRIVDYNRERNEISFESVYRWGGGKLFFEASGKVQYRDTDGDKALDNQVHLRVTRTF